MKATWASLAILVTVLGCATYRPPIVLMPTEAHGVHRFFSNGQPFAVIDTPERSMLMSLEPVELSGRTYARLWWLYSNQSADTVLVEPLHNLTLVAHCPKSQTSSPSRPDPPSRILHRIKNEALATRISQTIGASLQAAGAAMTTRPVQVTGDAHLTVHDPERARARSQEVLDRASVEIERTELAYRLYARSVNNGALRRNTVYPMQGVHGYVYLPYDAIMKVPVGYTVYDGKQQTEYGYVRVKPSEFEFTVIVKVGAAIDSVKFIPEAGE